MAFVKTKKNNGELYYYYVESFRRGDKVSQKNLKYLGKEIPTEDQIFELQLEFTEKKIQKLIRANLEYQEYKVELETLHKAEKLKNKFFDKLNLLSNVGREQLIKRFKTGFTYHSCSIEGNTLSRAEVDLIINKKQSIDGKMLLELLEVRNHQKAIEYMICEIEDLGELFVKKLHEELMRGTIEFKEFDEEFVEGGYRCDMRYIEGADFIPVPPLQIPYEMKDLISFYKKNKYKIHPIELAAEFHLRFVIIHPFSDGNGRMARLLMNFILDRSGFPMIDISVKNREQYIKALDSGKTENLTNFIYTELEKYVNDLFIELPEDKLKTWFIQN
jgi:Fic family protein